MVFDRFKNYIIDNKFKINMGKDYVNVVNYKNLLTIEKSRISIEYEFGILIIKGNDLTIKKLLDNEILVNGNIKTIDLE